MSDKNMQIVRRLLEEVWTQGNLSLLPELITEDAVAYPMPQFGAVHGSEGYKQFIAVYKGVFQEMNFHIEDQFSSGEKVATRWSSEVTDAAQDGAEGEHVTISGTTITHHDQSGKIVAEWASWDTQSLLDSAAAPQILEQLSLRV